MEPVAGLQQALAHLRDVVSRVPGGSWTTVTNCAPWSADTLFSHALASQLLWVGAVTGVPEIEITAVIAPEPGTGDRLARLDEVAAKAAAAWTTDGVLDRDITGAFGTLPGSTTITFPTIDALAHSWDLATSTGIDAELSEDLVALAGSLVDIVVTDTTRQFGLFAEPADAPAGGTPTDLVMARLGRCRP